MLAVSVECLSDASSAETYTCSYCGQTFTDYTEWWEHELHHKQQNAFATNMAFVIMPLVLFGIIISVVCYYFNEKKKQQYSGQVGGRKEFNFTTSNRNVAKVYQNTASAGSGLANVTVKIYLPEQPLNMGRFSYFGVKIDGKEFPAKFYPYDVIELPIAEGPHELIIRQMMYSYSKTFQITASEGKEFRIIVVDNDFCLDDPSTGLNFMG